MMYDVVAKKASASYCAGAGRAGGGSVAAAAGAGLDSEPQPASTSEAPTVRSAVRVFIRLPRDPLIVRNSCRRRRLRRPCPTMVTATTLHSGPISVVDFQCTAGPHDPAFPERHEAFSISYVRHGTFGYRVRGRQFEMVAGAVLIGFPGD